MDKTRRVLITTIPLGAALGASGCTSSSSPALAAFRFFTAHEAGVITAATARIAPGPLDDPAERGHPGAREANVTGYIDGLLEASAIFAGGPWSSRHRAGTDMMARFIPPDAVTRIGWQRRIAAARKQYRDGVALLDRLAGGDFTKAGSARQDKILASSAAASFLSVLFEHTIEGLYSNPEYGGNRGLAGWRDIGYPGDSQPRGYTAGEVTRSDGPDPVSRDGIVGDVLRFLGAV
jgi:gluconate 2-dehydrogenase gamma chain